VADEIDIVAEREMLAQEERHARARMRPARMGPPECVECGEEISEQRRAWGAIRCVHHQTEFERRGRR
jgi:RNA polymerase-binding transcription factor DksA